MISKNSLYKFTAQMREKNGINDDNTDKRYVLDDPDAHQLDNILGEIIEDCKLFFTD